MPIGAFSTDRLTACPWHEASRRLGSSLRLIVGDMLTESVTRTLPPGWQGPYDDDRAERWIRDRDEESEVLLITASSDHAKGEGATSTTESTEQRQHGSERPVGIMILSRCQGGNDDGEVRIGYLLSEDSWGKGYATEAVRGLVEASRANPDVRLLAGGVDADNVASARVLERNGFREVVPNQGGGVGGSVGKERFYRLQVQ